MHPNFKQLSVKSKDFKDLKILAAQRGESLADLIHTLYLSFMGTPTGPISGGAEIEVIKKKGRREDIDLLIQTFTDRMGFPPQGSKERIFATHLLRNFSQGQLEMMLNYCRTEKYAPRVGSLEKLWFKRGDIIAGLQKKAANPDVVDFTNPTL